MDERNGLALSCPACKSVAVKEWFTKSGHLHYRCRDCRHGFLWPVPPTEVVDQYYEELSDGYSSGCSWTMEPGHKLALWRRLLSSVEKNGGRGPLLDIGCGSGTFLESSRSQGWAELEGIEISPRAVAMARARSGAQLWSGSWRDVDLRASHYAVVSIFDVLEHDPDPDGLLTFIRHALRPGGALLLTVPHVSGLSLRFFGERAFTVIPPEHLAYYSVESIRRLLARSGFEIVSSFTSDIYIKEWLRFRPRAVTRNEDAQWDEARYRAVYARMTGTAALSVIGLANRLLKGLQLGDQLVVTARVSSEAVHD